MHGGVYPQRVYKEAGQRAMERKGVALPRLGCHQYTGVHVPQAPRPCTQATAPWS
jgi:hypothetical protein